MGGLEGFMGGEKCVGDHKKENLIRLTLIIIIQYFCASHICF